MDRLASRYGGSLIVDNALALYSPARSGVASLYSPRKFSGLPDGGIAVMDAERSLPEPEERDESLPAAAFCWNAWSMGRKGLPPPVNGMNGACGIPRCEGFPG